MAFTAVVNQSLSSGGQTVAGSVRRTANASQSFATPIADSVTDQLLEITLNVSEIKAIIIVSDQDVTLETNAVDATGGNTLALLANEPYVWYDTSLFTNLLTLDITKIYLTNASGSAATVEIEVVYDPTP